MTAELDNIFEVEKDLNNIRAKWHACQAEVQEINDKLLVTMPKEKYFTLQKQRKEAVSRLVATQAELSAVKQRRKELLGNDEMALSDKKMLVRMLREVRDKYQAMSCGELGDLTLGESQLAAKVVMDLQKPMQFLLKP